MRDACPMNTSKTGTEKFSRRGFLKAGCVTAAGLAVNYQMAQSAQAQESEEAPRPVRTIALGGNLDSLQVQFGVGRLEAALAASQIELRRQPPNASGSAVVLVFTSEAEAVRFAGTERASGPALKADGYRILRRQGSHSPALCVLAGDETGAMYGLLDLAEQARAGTLPAEAQEKRTEPRFAFRAIKFNLPWMSYRKGEALQLHMDTCRDLAFWQPFLDMMAENRYNALTLWNLHPFTFMVRPTNFPEACAFSDAALAEWQTFWHSLFRMAKERGIETYIVNWNTFVSPEFARAHHVAEYSEDWGAFGDGDTSELVKRYTRECVTQVIDEYPDLTGLGITLGERMGGMTPQEREDWLLETFGVGMKAAKRPIKFIHRAPLSADKGSGGSTGNSVGALTRAGISQLSLPTTTWVEMKFNWSHAYSSPKLLMTHGGKLSDEYWNPPPKDYKIAWMLRNEDFFVLRWGDPEFARQVISLNSQEYVGGFFVGSECYIPAKNYLDKPGLPGRAAYAFQRQWLLYMIWGRLLYDPATPDAVFAEAFDARCGKGVGKPLLAAFAAASRMPMALATFHGFTWDFTLYAEGFLAPAAGGSVPAAGGSVPAAGGSVPAGSGKNGFLTVDDMIHSKPINPNCVTIPEYVKAVQNNQPFVASRATPLSLATTLEQDGNAALKLVEPLTNPAALLAQEIADIKAWAFLSLYFADKLRAGVALETFRRTGDAKQQALAVAQLTQAAAHWNEVISVTRPFHDAVPLLLTGDQPFSWERYQDAVQQDIEIARRGHEVI